MKVYFVFCTKLRNFWRMQLCAWWIGHLASLNLAIHYHSCCLYSVKVFFKNSILNFYQGLSLSIDAKDFFSFCKAYPDFFETYPNFLEISKIDWNVNIQPLLKHFLLRPRLDGKGRKMRLYNSGEVVNIGGVVHNHSLDLC